MFSIRIVGNVGAPAVLGRVRKRRKQKKNLDAGENLN
jgi:hypothetical protein